MARMRRRADPALAALALVCYRTAVAAVIPTAVDVRSIRPETVLAASVDSLLEDVLSSTARIDLGYRPPKSELELDRFNYVRTRDGCDWQTSTIGYVVDVVPAGTKPETTPNTTMRMDTCVLGTSSKSGLRVARIGPIISTGGYDWHTAQSSDEDDPLDLNSTIAAHGGLWITSFDMSPLDANLSLLGFPPIHIHHSHLASKWDWVDYHPKFYPEHGLAIGFSHADTACHPDAGGPLCQLFTFPAGYGVRYEQTLGFDALLNDVRDEDSSPMTWYFEIGLTFTTAKKMRPIGLTYSNTAVDFDHPAAQWFGTFEIPALQDSLNWAVTRYEYSGKVRNIWLHTHEQYGFNGAWLVNGAPEQLGLNSGVWRKPPPMHVFRPAEHNVTTNATKAHILRHMKSHGLSFRCIFTPYFVHIEDYRPGKYGLQPYVDCYEGADHVEAGEPITMISFFSPSMVHAIPEPATPPTADTLYQLHVHYQSFVDFDETRPLYPSTEFYQTNQNDSTLFPVWSVAPPPHPPPSPS